MRSFQKVAALLFSATFGVVLATTDTNSPAELNFRPENVTLSKLYRWVGSYYNGTTSLEIFPYAGLAASETEYCPGLRNKTMTTSYKTLLALTEPASYNNLKDDPVNAFLTVWPPGFHFSSIPDWKIIQDMIPSLQYTIFSSNPVYYNYSMAGENNFIWSLEETKAPPYNLSSTLSDYEGFEYWAVNSTTDCGETKVLSWSLAPISYTASFNGTNFTEPILNLQFDSTTANLSMEGYVEASVKSKTGPDFPLDAEDVFVFVGKFVMSFSGVIDSYHSDVLRNDTATPTWLRTVGYQNNSLNVGYTTTSESNQLGNSCLFAAALLLLQMLGWELDHLQGWGASTPHALGISSVHQPALHEQNPRLFKVSRTLEMDPLSISLGIAGILPLIASAITTANEYIDNVRSAKESIATLVIELEALQSNVENLQDLLKGEPLTTSSIQFQESSVLRTCSAACETRLRSLCKKLVKDTNRKGSRLLWPFTEKEYQKLIQDIRNFTHWMGFALSIEGCRLLSRTSDDVLELMGQQLEQFRTIQRLEANTVQILDFVEDQRRTSKVNIEKETRTSILNWISNGKHDQKHQLIQSSRVENTGKWILQKEEFIQWRNNSSTLNVLVCYGIQGSGKTNLASILIDELIDSRSDENSPVAYFYFDHQDQSSQRTPLVLRSILRQILRNVSAIPSAIIELYEKSGRNGQIPVHESERFITDLVSDLNCVYLIFDGLDESEHRTTFLQSIQNLVRSPKVRCLVTCRPHILDLTNTFQQYPKLEIEADEEDLKMCLRQELNEARLYDIADHAFVSRLMRTLTQNADGMFLLPILQLRTILKEPTIGEMEDRIADMSYSLSDAFADTISRIQRLPESRSRLGMGALMWLSHTPRAMPILELSDALAARSVENAVNVKYRPSIKTILECCQGLATVDVEGYVRLSHYAIQEYLRENSNDLFPKAKATIAVTCLRYLVLQDFHDGPWLTDSEVKHRMEIYPFLTWAAVHWGQFTRLTETDAQVWSALLLFFACPAATAVANQVLQYSKGKRLEYYDSEECKSFSALHDASRHGLKRAVSELLDSGAYDVNKLTEMGSTPVIHAASAGHIQTTRTLLDHGANPRLRNWYGDALHCAIESDKSETVRELIRWGMDPNAIDSNNANRVRELIKWGMDHSTIENDKQTYLDCALDGDCAGAFAALVEHGADIQLQSAGRGATHIFFTAALWGCDKIAVLMLERGWANIEMRDPRGLTVLHFAVMSEDPTTVRRLINAGAGIYEADNAGHTALDYTEVAKNKTILSLLLASKSMGTSLPYRN